MILDDTEEMLRDAADESQLFYGRPTFKPLPGMEASRLDEHLAMCLVFDAALMARSERLLPFDSGGFACHASSPGMLPRDAFELPEDPEAPPRIISAFYESNLDYFRQVANAMRSF